MDDEAFRDALLLAFARTRLLAVLLEWAILRERRIIAACAGLLEVWERQ